MNRLDRFIALAISLAVLIVYGLTLTPSLSYLSPDGSELATIPYILGLAHSPGYPLYTWLGFLFSRLIPLGDVAYRINLMSAVMGALAAGGLYRILIRILPEGIPSPLRRGAAALGVMLLAFSKTFWAQSLIAEVYAPNAAALALTLISLLHWERTRRLRDFFFFALVFGLSLGMHISDLGFAPAFLVFILLCLFEPGSIPADRSPMPFIGRIRSLMAVAAVGGLGFVLGAAQFLWLPFQAGSLIDRAMIHSAPTTLAGIYNYTLGAFPNFKFAFALTALPDRLVIYLDLLNQQFGLAGIGLGILGLFSLLLRRTRYFFLFVGMYLVQIWFFIQYSAFDLDVFFIPAHMLWAVFLAFGLNEIIIGVQFLWGRWARAPRPYKTNRIAAGAGCIMILFAAVPLQNNWSANDFSQDTAVNDFYANVWSVLPQDAALITPSGVFGYDAFYWQLVYDTRPDVLLPLLPGPNPSSEILEGRDVFATTRAITGNRGPGALPSSLLNQNYWSIPVLLGQQPEESFGRRETLALYHLLTEPPPLLEIDPQPQILVEEDLGPVQLLGYDLSSQQIESGDFLFVKFYWKLNTNSALRVETLLGEFALEEHEIGFGLLTRYSQSVSLTAGSVVSDSYGVVIPSGLQAGTYAFSIRSTGVGTAPGKSLELGMVNVINETGTMERWLQIAGK